jgi:hypothetical protein
VPDSNEIACRGSHFTCKDYFLELYIKAEQSSWKTTGISHQNTAQYLPESPIISDLGGRVGISAKDFFLKVNTELGCDAVLSGFRETGFTEVVVARLRQIGRE